MSSSPTISTYNWHETTQEESLNECKIRPKTMIGRKDDCNNYDG